jgi:hypothetical protein
MGENDNILIEKYLEKSLTAAEQQAFDERLTDPTFAHEVKLYKEALMSIYTLGDTRIKGILQEEETKRVPPQYLEATTPEISSPLKVRRWWAMAASFLIVVSVGYWAYSKTNTPEALFASKFEAYKSFSFDPNSRGKTEETTLTEVYRAYSNEKYRIFITYFEKFNDLTNDELFLMANAYLGIGNSEKAITILLNIAANNANTHKDSAEWYLALAYLKQGNTAECRKWLEKIKANPNNVYKKRANELAEKLP